jgi:hypothetical protein
MNISAMQFVVELHFTVCICGARCPSVCTGKVMMEDTILRIKTDRTFEAYDCRDSISLIQL